MTLRIIVTGSRHWTDRQAIAGALAEAEDGSSVKEITPCHGDAPGADTMAGEIAEHYGWRVEVFRADWSKHGNAAGPERNARMVESGADIALAFPYHVSPGTWDCIRRCVAAGIHTRIYPRKP